VVGKGSGLDSVREALEQLGMTATDDEVAAILAELKAASIARRAS
jgi:hypothetical protein